MAEHLSNRLGFLLAWFDCNYSLCLLLDIFYMYLSEKKISEPFLRLAFSYHFINRP